MTFTQNGMRHFLTWLIPMLRSRAQLKNTSKKRFDFYSMLSSFIGTSCTLSLPRKNVGDEDVVRIVFSCHDQKPSGEEVWGEEVGKLVEAESKTGKFFNIYINPVIRFQRVVFKC